MLTRDADAAFSGLDSEFCAPHRGSDFLYGLRRIRSQVLIVCICPGRSPAPFFELSFRIPFALFFWLDLLWVQLLYIFECLPELRLEVQQLSQFRRTVMAQSSEWQIGRRNEFKVFNRARHAALVDQHHSFGNRTILGFPFDDVHTLPIEPLHSSI
ncbi:hypothetical protein A4F85_04820 [Delftia sp. GW456-R20]|nr:hypothetical protein A4F85_04820 [Delftia sp. GW456-R20]